MLSPTSKVPRRHAKIVKEGEEGAGKLTSSVGYVREETETFDTPPPPPLLSHFLKPPGYEEEGLRSCSPPLIVGHAFGNKAIEQQWLYFHIYAHGNVIREECKSERSKGPRLVRHFLFFFLSQY